MKKIAVAMSGGVDSTVAVVLLKEQGYEVVGITLDMLGDGEVLKGAKDLADKMGIEHHSFDVSKEFHEKIIDYFVKTYKDGMTPSPCVMCNKFIKFGILADKARELGCEKMATGHYIIKKDGNLYMAKDHHKDQTYFLFNISQEQIDFCEFPLGEYTKPEIIEISEKHGVSPSGGESQDICFVENGKYAEFIENRSDELPPAKIVDTQGNVLKEHKSIINYTIGQRKGLDIGGLSEPMYVIKIDANKNEVVVGTRDQLATTRVNLVDINWLGDSKFLSPCGRDKELGSENDRRDLEGGNKINNLSVTPNQNCDLENRTILTSPQGGSNSQDDVFVKLRYKSRLVSTELHLDEGYILLSDPDFAVAPGQAAVFYNLEGRLLGGGFIK